MAFLDDVIRFLQSRQGPPSPKLWTHSRIQNHVGKTQIRNRWSLQVGIDSPQVPRCLIQKPSCGAETTHFLQRARSSVCSALLQAAHNNHAHGFGERWSWAPSGRSVAAPRPLARASMLKCSECSFCVACGSPSLPHSVPVGVAVFSTGHHRAACATVGVLGGRGFALESAAARVCCEASACDRDCACWRLGHPGTRRGGSTAP